MSAEAHARGSLLVYLRAHVLEHHGEAGWRRVLDRLTSSDRDQLGTLLVSGSWAKIGLWNRGWAAYLAWSGREPEAEMLAFAKRVSDGDMHTIFKLTLRLASAATIVRRADWLWTRYFDVGTLSVHEEGPRDFRMRLDAATAEDDGPGEAICRYGVRGWLTHALALSGAPKAQVLHTRCRFSFTKHCDYHVTW